MRNRDRREFFLRLQAQAQAARQRRVAVLLGSERWCRESVAELPGELGLAGSRWRGRAPPGWTALPGGAQATLGREFDVAGFDVREGVDADMLGALAGSLRAGGLFILCGPALADWPSTGASDAHAPCASRFLRRWAGLLAHAPEVELVHEAGGWPVPELPEVVRKSQEADAEGCLTADQRAAVAAVTRVVTGHRRRPAVLTADRGRGKSAAFGLASAALMRERALRILVTGPSFAAVAPVFGRAAARLPEAHAQRGWLQAADSELRFVAPDALLREGRRADLLLVDEAAALPVGLLERLLERHSRIAFATTVHGYEGSGRAFALRFNRVLDRRTPGWSAVRLEEPVRWASGDPLERLAARLLLLDTEAASDTVLASATPGSCRVVRIDRGRLAADEAMLREVFGLLVLAHYRTRPRDLLQWLDGDGVTLWMLRYARRVAGVAIGVREGGLDVELARDVAAGRRRIRGQLVAQSLLSHLGLTEAGCLKGLRILRMAVHPALQGRGLGGRLLAGVVEAAHVEGLDWAGASFGAETRLLRFWRASDFRVLRMGFTREASSGEYAALVLRGLTSEGDAACARGARRFAAGLPAWLRDPLRGLDPGLTVELLDCGGSKVVAADQVQEALAFSAGGKEFEDALPALHDVCLARMGEVAQAGTVDAATATALVARVLQARPWGEVAALLEMPGRAQVIALLREGVARLLVD